MSTPKKPEQQSDNMKSEASKPEDIEITPREYVRSEALKKAILKLKTQTLPRFEGNLETQVTERLPSVHASDDDDTADDDATLTLEKTLTRKEIEELRVASKNPAAQSDVWELPKSKEDDAAIVPTKPTAASTALTARDQTPWTLQQFFDGEIDLDIELSKRFPTMPLLSIVKFRSLGARSGRKVATLDTTDGSASLIIDADTESKVIQLSFTYGSMMTLRYSLLQLSDMDRSRWIELMRRDGGGLAFLWGPSRWQDDYLICIARKSATNIYAFSPRSFESAVRLTPAVHKQLIDWLEEVWQAVNEEPEDDDNPLLTW